MFHCSKAANRIHQSGKPIIKEKLSWVKMANRKMKNGKPDVKKKIKYLNITVTSSGNSVNPNQQAGYHQKVNNG